MQRLPKAYGKGDTPVDRTSIINGMFYITHLWSWFTFFNTIKGPVKITDIRDAPLCMQQVYKEFIDERNAYVGWKNMYDVRPDNTDTSRVTAEYIMHTINEFIKLSQTMGSHKVRKFSNKAIYNEFKAEFEGYRNHKSGTYRIKLKTSENVL